VGQEVASLVEVEVRKSNKKLAGSLKAMEQSLALAASGFNRDMYPELGNPLKAALVDTLKSLNIRNAAQVVQAAFAESADEYHQSLIAKTVEYMQKSDDIRNELAKVMAGATPDTDFDDEDEDEDVGLEDDEPIDDEDEESSFQVRSAYSSLTQPTRRVKGAKQEVKSSLFPKIVG
jgi:hypothetical protein